VKYRQLLIFFYNGNAAFLLLLLLVVNAMTAITVCWPVQEGLVQLFDHYRILFTFYGAMPRVLHHKQ
jgi:hypothetical protein